MTAGIEIRQVVRGLCTESDLDLGALVLGKAFEHNAFAVTATGHLGFDTIVAFERGAIAAAVIGGIVYYAYDEHGDVAGVSVWFQPGHAFLAEQSQIVSISLLHTDIFSSKEQAEVGTDQLFETFPPELKKWWSEQFLPKHNEQSARALGPEGKLNSWHLQLIGVSPEFQGRGIGAALVKAGEERAKIERKPVVLEASAQDNVEKFYKRLRYQIKPSGPPEHPEYEVYTDFEGKYAFSTWIMIKEFK